MKLLRRVVIVVVVLAIVVVAGAFFYVDTIAKTAIEKGATYALGVKTTLQRANVGILKGDFSMNGLLVANPTGFDADYFLTLGRGEVAVTLGSLSRDVVELPLLALDSLDLILEKKGAQSNYKVILDHVKQNESKRKREPQAETGKEGKRFLIREILITNVNVRANLFGVGGDLDTVHVPIKEIHLTDVGSQGLTTQQTTDLVLKAVLAAVMKNAADLPAEFANDLGISMEGLTGLSDMGIKSTMDMAGKTVSDLTKGTGGLGKGIEDLGGIEEGLGGLLGGKKKE